jgi:sugar O-acyltransferase (sialic acid O-acetyltransferase NeuD family)
MAKVVIFGTGRGSDISYRYLTLDSPHEVVAFTVDHDYRSVDSFHDLPVIDFEDIQNKFPPREFQMLVPLGFKRMNKVRQAKYMQVKEKGYTCVSYVSSTIPQLEKLQIGENCLILDNQSINFDVKVGNNVIMWSSNHIGDNSIIMDHVWISSHACIAGNVTIKPFCVIGINAAISHNVTVEEECFIGANTLIVGETYPKGVYLTENTKKAPLTSDKFIAMVQDY